MIHLAHPSTPWLITTSITALFAILYPLVLVEVLRRRLGAGWKYAAFGALIFFVFQVVTRIPLVALITPRVTPLLKSSLLASVIWLLVLAITAGIFEEVGRYVGYRVLMRREQKTWEKAVLYGVGHGGLESILLVGLSLIGTLISFFVLSSINLANLPVARRVPLLQQYAALAAQPGWLPLLGLWERLWTLPAHIALSVIVLQVFLRGQRRWLWWAVLAHALVDFSTVAIHLPFKGHPTAATLASEVVVFMFGVIALWVIWVLRPVGRSRDETPVIPYPLIGEQSV